MINRSLIGFLFTFVCFVVAGCSSAKQDDDVLLDEILDLENTFWISAKIEFNGVPKVESLVFCLSDECIMTIITGTWQPLEYRLNYSIEGNAIIFTTQDDSIPQRWDRSKKFTLDGSQILCTPSLDFGRADTTVFKKIEHVIYE